MAERGTSRPAGRALSPTSYSVVKAEEKARRVQGADQRRELPGRAAAPRDYARGLKKPGGDTQLLPVRCTASEAADALGHQAHQEGHSGAEEAGAGRAGQGTDVPQPHVFRLQSSPARRPRRRLEQPDRAELTFPSTSTSAAHSEGHPQSAPARVAATCTKRPTAPPLLLDRPSSQAVRTPTSGNGGFRLAASIEILYLPLYIRFAGPPNITVIQIGPGSRIDREGDMLLRVGTRRAIGGKEGRNLRADNVARHPFGRLDEPALKTSLWTRRSAADLSRSGSTLERLCRLRAARCCSRRVKEGRVPDRRSGSWSGRHMAEPAGAGSAHRVRSSRALD